MELIVVPQDKINNLNGSSMVQFACSSKPVSQIFIEGLKHHGRFCDDISPAIALPDDWKTKFNESDSEIIHYAPGKVVGLKNKAENRTKNWFVRSNGRFATDFSNSLLQEVLSRLVSDVVAINVTPALASHNECARITPEDHVVGFSRCYSDSVQPAPISDSWPHHVFMKSHVFEKMRSENRLFVDFKEFVTACRTDSLRLECFDVGGSVLDIGTEAGLLKFLTDALALRKQKTDFGMSTIEVGARFFGQVVLGENVRICENAIVVGPAIIGDGCTIGENAAVKNAILGPGISVPRNGLVQNSII